MKASEQIIQSHFWLFWLKIRIGHNFVAKVLRQLNANVAVNNDDDNDDDDNNDDDIDKINDNDNVNAKDNNNGNDNDNVNDDDDKRSTFFILRQRRTNAKRRRFPV